MAALVDDLLELSRLESATREPEWDETGVGELVDDVLASFAGPAGRKQVQLARTGGGDPAVVSDPERLRRILENLVDNAVKYTPPGGRVEVEVFAGPDGAARVTIADNGPGIPAEHLPRIFERFYRVDKARSRATGGTGLGLAIVRHVAQAHGGEVTVESIEGQGSTFRLALPRVGAAMEAV